MTWQDAIDLVVCEALFQHPHVCTVEERRAILAMHEHLARRAVLAGWVSALTRHEATQRAATCTGWRVR